MSKWKFWNWSPFFYWILMWVSFIAFFDSVDGKFERKSPPAECARHQGEVLDLLFSNRSFQALPWLAWKMLSLWWLLLSFFIIYYFVNSRVSVPSKVLIYTGSLMPTADMRFPLIFSAQFSPRTEEDLSNRNLPQNLKGERFKVCKPGISDKRCHFWILRFSLWEWNLLQNYTVQER